jgi:hypothetical protein
MYFNIDLGDYDDEIELYNCLKKMRNCSLCEQFQENFTGLYGYDIEYAFFAWLMEKGYIKWED